MTPEAFENVFAPEIDQDRLNIDQIMLGLTAGMIRASKLPPDVQAALAAEMDRREREDMTPMRLLVLLLGTMGEIKHKTRLQKYAFLADSQYSQSQDGSKTKDLVCRWKLHRCGPFSEYLDLCVREAMDARLVTASEIRANKSRHTTYRLTVRGNAEHRRLLQSRKRVSRSIRGLLARFQHDSSEAALAKLVAKTTLETNLPGPAHAAC
ncbi:MAG: hypothetical protein EB824_03805 [Thaumarchaeota archaeon S15]|nr:hypothetical protein [Nitrososphaerota archaeon]RNJ74288.1 MAG: hypothetical protein EB824_03805 [Thaumarchaeota archaeon S15]